MRSWPKSTERLLGVSARLLAGASVLTTIGVGLTLRMAWNQVGQNYGPDGLVEDSAVPFAQRLTMVMFDLSYRQNGAQLLLATALVGAAVVVLHRNGTWARGRRVRWEVLAAGVVVAVPVAGLLLANLYVLTPSDDANGGLPEYMGPQPTLEPILGNLPPLAAAALVLTAAGLWWLRVESVPVDTDEVGEGDSVDLDEDSAVGADGTPDTDGTPHTDGSSDTDGTRAHDRISPVEPVAAVRRPAPAQVSDSADGEPDGVALGYPQDWSPEDFRRPAQSADPDGRASAT